MTLRGSSSYPLAPFVVQWEDGTSHPTGEEQSLPNDGSDAEAIAIDGGVNGDWFAVGRPDFGGPGQVDLYLKDLNGDYQAAQSIVQGSSSGLRYGAALDLDMGTEVLVVGMPRTDPGDNGFVFHYRLIGGIWTLQDFFVAPGGIPGDRFGSAISLSGNWLAVGAPMIDTAFPQPLGTEVGAVHVYELVSGTFEHRVSFFGGGSGYDHFGSSVALEGRRLVAGSPDEDLDVPPFPLYSRGAAYLYWRGSTAWDYVARLQASDGSALDFFGTSVALAGRGALVGAPYADYDADDDAGAVYYFEGLTPFFFDGFESGDTGGWSQVAP